MEGEGSRPSCSLSDAFCWRTRVSCIRFLCSTSSGCQEQLSFPLACMGLARLKVPKALSMRVGLSLISVAGPRWLNFVAQDCQLLLTSFLEVQCGKLGSILPLPGFPYAKLCSWIVAVQTSPQRTGGARSRNEHCRQLRLRLNLR